MYLRLVKPSHFDDSVNGRTGATMTVGKIIAMTFLLIVFVPFFLFLLTRLIYNWGWWKVRHGRNCEQYVKTWRGWVRQHADDEKRFGHRWSWEGKSTTARRVHIAWTPEGATVHHPPKQRLQALPRRLLPCIGLQDSNMRSSDRCADVEMGCIPEPPAIRIISATPANTVHTPGRQRSISVDQVDGPSETWDTRTSHVMSGGLRYSFGRDDIEDTIRRRRGSTDGSTAWQANSSETSRATHEQFIKPIHDFRTPIWAEILFGNGASQDTTTPLSSRRKSGTHAQPQSASQPPIKSSHETHVEARIAGRRAVRSTPTFSPPLTLSPVTDLRSSTQLSADIELDDLNTYLESGSRYGSYRMELSGKALPINSLRAFTPPTLARSQSLTQRLNARARTPSFSSLFLDTKRKYNKGAQVEDLEGGIAVKDTLFSIDDDTMEHSAGPSIDGATSYYEEPPWPQVKTPEASGQRPSGCHQDVRQDVLGSSEFSTDTHQPLRSITNGSAESAPMPSRVSSHEPSKPRYSSISRRKRGNPAKTRDMMEPPRPEIKPRYSAGRMTLIPSIQLDENLVPTITLLPRTASPAALKAAQEELRERLQWLDLRCTLKVKDDASQIHVSEDEDAQVLPHDVEANLAKRRGLRRVGHFERGPLGAVLGKENLGMQRKENADFDSKSEGADVGGEKGIRTRAGEYRSLCF